MLMTSFRCGNPVLRYRMLVTKRVTSISNLSPTYNVSFVLLSEIIENHYDLKKCLLLTEIISGSLSFCSKSSFLFDSISFWSSWDGLFTGPLIKSKRSSSSNFIFWFCFLQITLIQPLFSSAPLLTI